MKLFMIGLTGAIAMALITPVWAQVAAPGAQIAYGTQQAAPPAGYAEPYPYPYPGLAPRDAYRTGLINRFELERFEGPQPQALQGPSVDGYRNFQ